MTSASSRELPRPVNWTILQLPQNDQRLEEVVSIWGLNRATLGLFPRGAFDDCVALGRLAIALDNSGKVVGYLTFRVQRRLNSVAIIHLCVGAENRGAGVAEALTDWLKSRAREMRLSALRLKCRRDYHAEKLWQRLGFVARADVRGRGKQGDELTVWVHALGAADDLFTQGEQGADESKLTVAIDANVFFDLHGDDASSDNESKVLQEPWVDDAVTIHVVDELHNEINRHLIAEKREIHHRAASGYPELHYDSTKAAALETELDGILGKPAVKESEKSDRKQLARSAAAEVDIFLTRDGELIDAASEIEARLGVRVMRPTDLSGGLDETERIAAYQPRRLFATSLTHCALRTADIDAVVDRMQLSGLKEKPAQLAAIIRQHLAKVRSVPQSELNLVRDADDSMSALVVRIRPGAGEDGVIPLLRIARTQLERTLIRHLLLHAIQTNATEGRSRLMIVDKFITSLVAEALIELGFVQTGQGWVRHTPSFIGSRSALIDQVGAGGYDVAPFGELTSAEIEGRLWPAKLLGGGISSYIVPIAPTWAAGLFDSGLASGDLFGAFARLALNRENVYYRSARNGSFALPGRLLWYVNKDTDVPGTMAIRACSRLLSVEVDTAKILYGRHRRIGIYEWRQILATAKQNPHGEIMALRFSDTEQFVQPVAVSALRAMGISSTFQSPTHISEDQFDRIYRLGMTKPSA